MMLKRCWLVQRCWLSRSEPWTPHHYACCLIKLASIEHKYACWSPWWPSTGDTSRAVPAPASPTALRLTCQYLKQWLLFLAFRHRPEVEFCLDASCGSKLVWDGQVSEKVEFIMEGVGSASGAGTDPGQLQVRWFTELCQLFYFR